jgi:serine/threonine-protein kinase
LYKAYEADLDRCVALRVFSSELQQEPSFAEEFPREARRIAHLEHHRTVPTYGFGVEQSMPWIAMRWIAGGTLPSLLSNGLLESVRVISILRDAAEAVDYAHRKGISHRDIKPQKILFDDAGHTYLGDFGIAQLVEDTECFARTGSIGGTAEYMSPEQASGRPVDRRSDIYSLGVVAFEMITGRVPFVADTPEAVLLKHASEPVRVRSEEQVPESVLHIGRVVFEGRNRFEGNNRSHNYDSNGTPGPHDWNQDGVPDGQVCLPD